MPKLTVPEARAAMREALDADKEQARIAREERRVAEARVRAELAAALHRDLLPQLTHEQAERVFERAWDRGHADGLIAVADEYRELADLLRFVLGLES